MCDRHIIASSVARAVSPPWTLSLSLPVLWQGLSLHRGRYPYHCQFCGKGCLSTVDAIPITASSVARAVSPPWTLSLSLPVLWQGLSLHRGRYPYHCQFCGKGCLSTVDAIPITASSVARAVSPPWTLSLSLPVLWQGMSLHRGRYPYHCQFCGKGCLSTVDAIPIIASSVARAVSPPWTLSLSLPVLWQGLSLHRGRYPYHCRFCGKDCLSTVDAIPTTASSVARAVSPPWTLSLSLLVLWQGLSLHLGRYPYHCQFCGKGCLSTVDAIPIIASSVARAVSPPWSLSLSLPVLWQGLSLHRGRYPYHCQFCGKGCLSTVDAIPITASSVARAVSPPWTLSLSLPVLWQGLSLHRGRYPYHCQFCGKGCLSTVVAIPITASSVARAVSPPWTLSLSLPVLWQGMSLHRGRYPYHCQFCGKGCLSTVDAIPITASSVARVVSPPWTLSLSLPVLWQGLSLHRKGCLSTVDAIPITASSVARVVSPPWTLSLSLPVLWQGLSLHRGRYPYHCQFCGKGCLSTVDAIPIIASSVARAVSPPWTLSLSLPVLWQGLSLHRGRYPYHCQFCGKGCLSTVDAIPITASSVARAVSPPWTLSLSLPVLWQGLSLHRGLYPYHCQFCGKGCLSTVDAIPITASSVARAVSPPWSLSLSLPVLWQGLSLHRGRYPYHCQFCGKGCLSTVDAIPITASSVARAVSPPWTLSRSLPVLWQGLSLHRGRYPYHGQFCGKGCLSTVDAIPIIASSVARAVSPPWTLSLSLPVLWQGMSLHRGRYPYHCQFCGKGCPSTVDAIPVTASSVARVVSPPWTLSLSWPVLWQGLSLHRGRYPYHCQFCGKGCLSTMDAIPITASSVARVVSPPWTLSLSWPVLWQGLSPPWTLSLSLPVLWQGLSLHRGRYPYHCQFCGKGCLSTVDAIPIMASSVARAVSPPWTLSLSLPVLWQWLSLHRGRYPYHCQFCGKGCLSTVDAIPITASSVARAVSPPWTLSLSLPVLWQGLSLHRGRYPYHCQFCGKDCPSTTNLRRHLVKHTGVRDHKCTLCSKEFSCPWSLRRHINTHKDG